MAVLTVRKTAQAIMVAPLKRPQVVSLPRRHQTMAVLAMRTVKATAETMGARGAAIAKSLAEIMVATASVPATQTAIVPTAAPTVPAGKQSTMAMAMADTRAETMVARATEMVKLPVETMVATASFSITQMDIAPMAVLTVPAARPVTMAMVANSPQNLCRRQTLPTLSAATTAAILQEMRSRNPKPTIYPYRTEEVESWHHLCLPYNFPMRVIHRTQQQRRHQIQYSQRQIDLTLFLQGRAAQQRPLEFQDH